MESILLAKELKRIFLFKFRGIEQLNKIFHFPIMNLPENTTEARFLNWFFGHESLRYGSRQSKIIKFKVVPNFHGNEINIILFFGITELGTRNLHPIENKNNYTIMYH